MNERVKELRKALGLSGEKFGAKLGVGRSAISDIETGRNKLSESNILAICREFNVNESWLRTGDGSMFHETDQIPLEDLTQDADPLEVDILTAYFSLPKDLRKKALDHFKTTLCEKE